MAKVASCHRSKQPTTLNATCVSPLQSCTCHPKYRNAHAITQSSFTVPNTRQLRAEQHRNQAAAKDWGGELPDWELEPFNSEEEEDLEEILGPEASIFEK